MGTTSTAIQSGEGVQLCWVLAIEGYERLLTDHANLGAITTAWVGTDWSLALPGLQVRGSIRQSIEPWGDTIDAPELTFAVQPDDDDTFGIAVWKLKPSFKTRLTALFAPASDGTGTMQLRQTAGAAAAGSLYYGGRQLKYSGKTATDVTVTSANHYSPFGGDGVAKYVPPHGIASGEYQETSQGAKVQDTPRTWVGKKVALYLCRISGGVVDGPAQAQLEFAGRIKRVFEDAQGFTCLECVDLRADIRDAVLHRKQWVGYVREGIRLNAGMTLRALEATSAGAPVQSTELTVVASGASGSSELNEGYYSIYDFVSYIDRWLQANSATFSSDWSCGIKPYADGGGLRTVFTGTRTAAAATKLTLLSNSLLVLQFLGFDADTGIAGYPFSVPGPEGTSTTTYHFISQRAPYRVRAVQTTPLEGVADHRRSAHVIELVGKEGTFWDHTAYLPPQLLDEAESAGGTWSLFKIGDALYWGKYVSDTSLTDVIAAPALGQLVSGVGPGIENGLTVDDSGEHLEVRQVLALSGSFAELVPRLFASVGGDGTNHADYDVFPMGAGIPWSLLGDDFLASCRSLEQATRSGGMLLLLERPTKLVDVLLPELILRFAWIIFKGGGYQLISPPTPNALATDHDLDETNKAGQELDLRAMSEVTQKWLRNVVKVDYGRTLDNEYHKHLTVIDPTSIADYGESAALTIRAANAYADSAGTGASVEDLSVNLIAKHLPFFARPMKVVTRSISPDKFDIAPGETATLNDDFVRDPTTGRRGMANRAGVVIDVVHDWGAGGGQLSGEVVVMFSEEDRTYPMSPCAEIDETADAGGFTDGYDSANLLIKLKQHQHSRSSDAKDVTHFAIGDEVQVVEIDPADPAAPRSWTRTVTDKDEANDTLELDAALTGFSASERYRVVPALYAEVTEGQQLHAFIAAADDGLIQDEAEPNMYGDTPQSAYSISSSLTLPRYIAAQASAEGRPVHPGLVADLGINLNHLVNYGCVRAGPMQLASSNQIDETGTSYRLHLVFPFLVGGELPGGFTRRINIAPEMATSGGTGYCRITVSKTPPRGSSLVGASWEDTKYQREFTTTDTTRTVQLVQQLNALVGARLVFVSVELKATAGQTTTFYGLAEMGLGPLQATV